MFPLKCLSLLSAREVGGVWKLSELMCTQGVCGSTMEGECCVEKKQPKGDGFRFFTLPTHIPSSLAEESGVQVVARLSVS